MIPFFVTISCDLNFTTVEHIHSRTDRNILISPSRVNSIYYNQDLKLIIILMDHWFEPLIQILLDDVFSEKMWQLLFKGGHFYHFRGLILCNAKLLQLNRYKKQEHSCTVQKVLYSTMSSSFKFDGVVGSIHFAQKLLSLRRLHYHFWWLLDKNYFLQRLAHVLQSWIWKNIARPLFIFNVMFMLGYYNEFTFVRRQILYKLF